MRNASRRNWWSRVLLGSALGILGCLSPTLPPLPPPDAPTQFEFQTSEELLIAGYVPARDSYVFVLNKDNNEIAGKFTSDGYYSIRLRAKPGDYLELWYEQGADESSTLGLEAPALPEEPVAPLQDAGSCDVAACADAGSESP